MTYQTYKQSTLPYIYYPLNDTTTTAKDYGANAVNGTYSSAVNPVFTPLTSGNIGSQIFNNRKMTFTHPSNMWNPSAPTAPFVIDMWVHPLSVATPTLIAGKSLSEGLSITTNGFVFSLPAASKTYSIFYNPPDLNKTFHVICAFTGNSMVMYSDGVAVASAVLNELILFSNTTSIQVGGNNASSVAISDFSLYKKVRMGDEIATDTNYGKICSDFNGMLHKDVDNDYYIFDDSCTKTVFDFSESTQEDFNNCRLLSNLTWNNNGFLELNDPSQSGERRKAFDIGEFGTIGGSRIDWDATGVNFAVSVSLDDGTTWISCTNHSTIPSLGNGTDTTNKRLTIKYSFTAPPGVTQNGDVYSDIYVDQYGAGSSAPIGTENPDAPVLYRTHVTIYSTPNVYSQKQTVAMTTYNRDSITFGEYKSNLLEQKNKNYMRIKPNGGFTLNPSSLAAPVAAFEILFRLNDYSNESYETIFDCRSSVSVPGTYIVLSTTTLGNKSTSTIGSGSGAYYVNGVARAITMADVQNGQWCHVFHIPDPSYPITHTMGINCTGSQPTSAASADQDIAYIATYATAPSAARINYHAKSIFGVSTNYITDSDTLNVSETASKAYNYAWQGQA